MEIAVKQYHKIQTVWKRDPQTKHRTLIEGDYATPEFQYLQYNTWVFTEKVDGTNIRVMMTEGKLTFGGKSENSSIPALLMNRLIEIFLPLETCMSNLFDDGPVCLYGEGYGAKIQSGGGKYSLTPEFVLFDVKVGDWWLKRKDVLDVAAKLGRINCVPVIASGMLDKMVDLAREGFNSTWGKFPAEGIVARPAVEMFSRNGKRIITKIKCKDFR